MEQDPEFKGDGNSYTTEFRQYDPRVGRWLSLDPLMHEFPWMSPYVAFNNNPIYFIDPLGLEGGDPDKEKIPTVDEDFGEINVTEIEDVIITPGNEVTIHAPKNITVITITQERESLTIMQKIGNFFRSVDNKLKGNAKWTFGIEFKTRDGKWNGNTANPVSLKDGDNVWTIYWDDIEEFTTALKALDKELPKEFRENPDYSGPGKFIDEAKKWIGPPTENTYKPNKQQDGKNWSYKENRLEKQTSDRIYIRVWKRDKYFPQISTTSTEGPFNSEEEMKKTYPNAVWNSENGYWESKLK